MDVHREACKGLLHPSESDAPFRMLNWPEEGFDPVQQMIALAGMGSEAEKMNANAFFAELVSGERGARLKRLHQVLAAALSGVQVFASGRSKRACA